MATSSATAWPSTGNTAVVGAPSDDQAGSNAGAAYVFVRTGNTWSEQQKLLGGDTAANDQFGASVAVAGDTVAIGAIGNDLAATSAGAAYVFVRSGTTWTEEAQLVASDATSNDFFGVSVVLEGDTALVGVRTSEGFATSPGGLAWDAGTTSSTPATTPCCRRSIRRWASRAWWGASGSWTSKAWRSTRTRASSTGPT